MGNNIPTAEEFLISKGLKGVGNLLVRDNSQYSENGTQKLMIEFAKMHVKAALKKASENAYVDFIDLTDDEIFDYTDVLVEDDIHAEVNKKSILNAYPLTNIK